jgi:NADPH:quinone reductase-like Zn-dependent oxidoreductase
VRAALVDPARRSVRLTQVPDPVPGHGQLLVAVRAAGVNRADLTTRDGVHRKGVAMTDSAAARKEAEKPVPPFVGGNDVAGEVVGLGAHADPWELGDRVMAQGAGFAELALVDARLALPVPDALTWEEAGAMPATLQTVNEAMRSAGRLMPGEVVLVQAMTSGVGMMAVSLAGVLGAALVIGTSRSEAKFRVLRSHFAALACPLVIVDSARQRVVDAVLASTDGRGVDLVVDCVGASAFDENFRCAAMDGRIVHIGRLGDARAEIDLRELARKRIHLVGSSWSTRTEEDKVAVAARCRAYGPDTLVQLRPRIDAVFPLDEVAAALDELGRNAHVGKLVVIP